MSAPDALAAGRATAARSSEAPGRLVVAWQHPIERSIQPVGFLNRTDDAFTFGYIRNAKAVHDFPGLLGFDDLYRTYESPELCPLFAQRAMDPRRPDTTDMSTRWDLKASRGRGSRSQGLRDTARATPSSCSPNRP